MFITIIFLSSALYEFRTLRIKIFILSFISKYLAIAADIYLIKVAN